MINRVFTRKIEDPTARSLEFEILENLNINTEIIKTTRYDISGLSISDIDLVKHVVFSEPSVNFLSNVLIAEKGYKMLAVEPLPSHYDQRAETAKNCIQIMTGKEKVKIKCATIFQFSGVDDKQLAKIKNFIINPLVSREASLELPKNLDINAESSNNTEVLYGFIDYNKKKIDVMHKALNLSMTVKDLSFIRDYYGRLQRNPTLTEIKVIDTFWSESQRRTTFITQIKDVKITSNIPAISQSLELYNELFDELYGKGSIKFPSLSDIASIATTKLIRLGLLDDIELDDDNQTCMVNLTLVENGEKVDYVINFKSDIDNYHNELLSHGCSATCLSGAVTDCIADRTYAYQALRISGVPDPLEVIENDNAVKHPKKVSFLENVCDYNCYSNQIGLATNLSQKIFNEKYATSQFESTFVVGYNEKQNINNAPPSVGDIVMLIGGKTGRDCCGGVTSLLKVHTNNQHEILGSVYKKGNPKEKRNLQKLLKNSELTTLIKKANGVGRGGIAVGVGNLAPGIDIDLSSVPQKYFGLSGTEVALSESLERIAVVIEKKDKEKFVEYCKNENVFATQIATVTELNKLIMTFDDNVIVDIDRWLIDTNGFKQGINVVIDDSQDTYLNNVEVDIKSDIVGNKYGQALLKTISDSNVCSQKVSGQKTDSTIGSGSIYMPFGGVKQLTPALVSACRIPSESNDYDVSTVASFGTNPFMFNDSPFIGAQHAVASAISKLIASGVDISTIKLSYQHSFKNPNRDSAKFGKITSAMLGALSAQIGFKVGVVCGSESTMPAEGKINIPQTFICYGLGIASAEDLITNVITKSDKKFFILHIDRDEDGVIDFENTLKMYNFVSENIVLENIKYASVVGHGGAVAEISKACIGSGIGFDFTGSERIFYPNEGDIIISIDEQTMLGSGFPCSYLGKTNDDEVFKIGQDEVELELAEDAFLSPIDNIISSYQSNYVTIDNANYRTKTIRVCKNKAKNPNILIPVFSGTIGEFDMAKKFRQAGGNVDIFTFDNLSINGMQQSIIEFEKRILKSQIIAFPSGYCSGLEVDSSNKPVVATCLDPIIAEAINNHINKKDGLILGLSNGFQAILKLGLIDHGMVKLQNSESSNLTQNENDRHISTIVNIKVASNKSPWFNKVKVGESFQSAISCGEGKFIASQTKIDEYLKNGMVATQYVDRIGRATMNTEFNPCGSVMAIEGLTSKCGRVLGKMCLNDRFSSHLYKNINGKFDMQIFKSGVNYFK